MKNGGTVIDFLSHAQNKGTLISSELLNARREQEISDTFDEIDKNIQALDRVQEKYKIHEKEEFLFSRIQAVINEIEQHEAIAVAPLEIDSALIERLAIIETNYPQKYHAIRKNLTPHPEMENGELISIHTQKIESLIEEIADYGEQLEQERNELEGFMQKLLHQLAEAIKRALVLVPDKNPDLLDEINVDVLQSIRLCGTPEQIVIILFPYTHDLTLHYTKQKQQLYEKLLLAVKEKYPQIYVALLTFAYKDLHTLGQVISHSRIPDQKIAQQSALSLLREHHYHLHANRLGRLQDV